MGENPYSTFQPSWVKLLNYHLPLFYLKNIIYIWIIKRGSHLLIYTLFDMQLVKFSMLVHIYKNVDVPSSQ